MQKMPEFTKENDTKKNEQYNDLNQCSHQSVDDFSSFSAGMMTNQYYFIKILKERKICIMNYE